jgi:FAD:protein FMN transferase
MTQIYQFNHRAMATHFQVRIANEERTYAAQAAQAAFDILEALESRLSRFRPNSEIAQIAALRPGDKMRLSEPAFACLEVARRIELLTHRAFSVTPAAMQTQASLPNWDLVPEELSIRCDGGQLQFDLGAIGKGFALDRMGALLCEWDSPAFLLVAGGSSILAGDPPSHTVGWSCGLGDDDATQRYFLTHVSLSGSGLAVKGQHILDPRTGRPALRQNRVWILADTAAESDALSTACMVLGPSEMEEILAREHSWLAFLDMADGALPIGRRSLPPRA